MDKETAPEPPVNTVSGGDSTWTRRMYLIGQLDAHYGRMLRQRVLSNYQDAKAEAESEAARDIPRTVALARYVRWMDDVADLAREGAEALEAARQCPDEFLDDLVRWQTNPNWREALTRAGMRFDTQVMRWANVL